MCSTFHFHSIYSQDPTFDRALRGMELLQLKLNSTADQDEEIKAAVVEEESEDILGVRPIELHDHLEVLAVKIHLKI